MSDIFINDKQRVRSGWRFLFFFTAFLFLTSIATIAVGFVLETLQIGFENKSLIGKIIQSIIGLTIAIILSWLCGKLFEDLPFRALGAWFTKYWLKDFLVGCVIGFISIGFAVLLAMLFGGLRFQFNLAAGSSAIYVTLLFSFIVYFFGAAFEEVLIRGYIFQTFVRAKLIWVALLLTSTLFAALHLGNPDAKFLSVLNTFLAGIWLGIAYLKTRTLWLAFGIHLGWNWFQGSLFGIEVSGLTDLSEAPILQEIDSGPGWITGADYGLEGGIACTFALIISTILIWYLPFLKPTAEMLELSNNEKSIEMTDIT